MGTVSFRKPKCGDCSAELDEEPGLPLEKRLPCQSCGSKKRIQFVDIQETIEMHATLSAKGKRSGVGKPFVEIVSGSSFSYQCRKWMRKLRLINRDTDAYKEIIIDPDTDLVIHQTEEKLSEHVGHGSARNSRGNKKKA